MKNGINSLDMALKKISIIIKRSIRSQDLLFRWHRDEFMILCQQISQKEFNKIASRIRDSIAKAPFCSNCNLTCSISMLEIKTHKTFNEILQKLQSRMKEVKNTNKNSIVLSNARLLLS